MKLLNKNILIGVTGSIAAYKVLDLISMLKQEGAHIKVVLTRAARQLVTPLSISSLIGQKNSLFTDDDFYRQPMLHIELARWLDGLVIAPASANVIAKMANGVADNLLLNIYIATNKLVAIAPAMNPNMWNHFSTVNNIKILTHNKVQIWGPSYGQVACGELGLGKMIPVSIITNSLINSFFPKPLTGVKVVVTAGPTVEELDSVRFISNYSSGKMGYALAQVAAFLGAQVTLISGPTNLIAPINSKVIQVKSTQQMEHAVLTQAKHHNILVMAAAVVDFTVSKRIEGKLAKKDIGAVLQLQMNNDILSKVTKLNKKPFCIGFAMESNDILEKAYQKLKQKQADIIIANKIGNNTGFNTPTNQVYIISQNQVIETPLMAKEDLAIIIWSEVLKIYFPIKHLSN